MWQISELSFPHTVCHGQNVSVGILLKNQKFKNTGDYYRRELLKHDSGSDGEEKREI